MSDRAARWKRASVDRRRARPAEKVENAPDLDRMQSGTGPTASYTAFWGRLGGVIVTLLGLGGAVALWVSG